MVEPIPYPKTEFQKWFYKKIQETNIPLSRQVASYPYLHEKTISKQMVIVYCYIFNCLDEIDYAYSIIERD